MSVKMRYLPALDGLRAIAVMLVFLFHTGHAPGGWVGVDIFFVLSGYLITSILLTEHERTGVINLLRFYGRRACRLLPALIIVIGVAVVIAVCLQNKVRDIEIDAVAALFYVLDYRYALMVNLTHATDLAHLWSLSIEEQFYFLWPLTLIILLKTGTRRMAFRMTLILILVVAAWRVFIFATRADPSFRIYFAFDTRVDELLIGCSLALWESRGSAARFLKPFWPVAAFLLAVVVLKFGTFNPSMLTGYSLLGAIIAYLIVIVINDQSSFLKHMLIFPPIVAFGRISYGFYLWHYLIIMELNKYLTVHSFVSRTFLLFSLSLIAAIVSYWLIERPFLHFKFSRLSSVPAPVIESLPKSENAIYRRSLP